MVNILSMLPTKPEKHCLYAATSLEWKTFFFENFHFHLPETSIIMSLFFYFTALAIIGHGHYFLFKMITSYPASLVQQVCEECYGRQHGDIMF